MVSQKCIFSKSFQKFKIFKSFRSLSEVFQKVSKELCYLLINFFAHERAVNMISTSCEKTKHD